MTLSAEDVLQTTFGFTHFREGQAEVVRTILEGRSTAAIFPTGSGKSLCYQLPAILLPHLTLVVSPLLALMQDQLSFLKGKGIAAGSIDSTQTREQAQAVMNGVREGRIKILMISVERLNNERFRQFIHQVPISLLVVDEAHCISEWGHNFRPDYLKLPQYRQEFNIPQSLLLTATATTKVIEDMGTKFGVERRDITVTGFYRSNLNLSVIGAPSANKLHQLSTWLKGREAQSGIVYVTLQKTAEDIAAQLREQGVQAQAYHAGLASDLRQDIQKRFMASEHGVIVATIAFGMGVDKSNIRFVVHYDLPKSIESYAQEIGRAGRDGNASDCLVLANSDNINVLENFVYGDTPDYPSIRNVLEAISESAGDSSQPGQWEVMLNSLSSQSNIRPLSLKTLLVYLEILQVIKPLYSYFAEYKFKYLHKKEQILQSFEGERQEFVNAVFNASKGSRVWSSMDFDQLYRDSSGERSRAVTALDYLDQKGMIELQAKQMTQVYHILQPSLDIDSLCERLFERFRSKEEAEIKRIHHLLAFYTSDRCLSQGLSEYFSDDQLQSGCGHCSVCEGRIAQLPVVPSLSPLTDFDFAALSRGIVEKLGANMTPVLVSRFFCGLPTPMFTRIKARSLPGFAQFENYRFSEVKNWVEGMLSS